MVWRNFRYKPEISLPKEVLAKKYKLEDIVVLERVKKTFNQKRIIRAKKSATVKRWQRKYLKTYKLIKDNSWLRSDVNPVDSLGFMSQNARHIVHKGVTSSQLHYFDNKFTARFYFQNNDHWNAVYFNDSWEALGKDLREIEAVRRTRQRLMRLSFRRTMFIESLLFRSHWINKFLCNLVRHGKKSRVLTVLFGILLKVKAHYLRSPLVLMFEIFEYFRMPLLGIPNKSKTKKKIERVHLVSWWKQYTIVTRWIATTLRSPYKVTKSWKSRLLSNMLLMIGKPEDSLVMKRVLLNIQLITYGRMHLHFRWYKHSRRAKRLYI